ncbi:MAG: hypothetical protein QNJ01_17185, partial [Desulfobacterales bacterium]|nr:hypothetical protein [Desulfobacterales bacterium]
GGREKRTGGIRWYFEDSIRAPNAALGPKDMFESKGAVSKLGFWLKIKAAVRFQPEEYSGISRIETERPTLRLGQKTI